MKLQKQLVFRIVMMSIISGDMIQAATQSDSNRSVTFLSEVDSECEIESSVDALTPVFTIILVKVFDISNAVYKLDPCNSGALCLNFSPHSWKVQTFLDCCSIRI
jgi:hypothetical protein